MQERKSKMSYKSECFNNELSTIKNPDIRKFCLDMLEDAPDYFFRVAASSTGKYHPMYALGDGGLVRHTKALVGIANELLCLEEYSFDDDTKDMIRVAGILHDAKKHGDNGSQYTIFEHPVVAGEWVMNSDSKAVDQTIKDKIACMIMSHMGQWNTNKHSSAALPKPETREQKFVHLCDYLASRRHLEYIFEQENPHSPTVPVPQEPDQIIMPFGKYKGQKLGDVKQDVNYFTWVYDNCDLREPLKSSIEKIISKNA